MSMFILGMFVGTLLGFILAAFCHAAKRGDENENIT